MSTAIPVKPESSAARLVRFEAPCSLLDEMSALADRIRLRAFDLFQHRDPWAGNDWSDWFRAESEILKPVPVEISESEEDYGVRAEVPGFQAGELTVRAEGNSICIQGKSEKKEESKDGEQVKYTEVNGSELFRRVDLPGAINAERATATLTNGVLTLSLPKAALPKKVEVKAA